MGYNESPEDIKQHDDAIIREYRKKVRFGFFKSILTSRQFFFITLAMVALLYWGFHRGFM